FRCLSLRLKNSPPKSTLSRKPNLMTILWLIERLLVKPTEGSNTDVVITADWRCNGSQESFSGTCYGSCSFAPPSGSFTPYNELTQQQVLDWCFANGVDQAAIEANVSLQIQNQINPPVVSLPLPWVPPIVEQKEPVLVAEPATVVDSLVA
ncbi:hypothetical protein UFOVP175_49, partial [uncultured Caudovirales phage]